MRNKARLLNIIYLAGSGRSGSTLLGDLIGSLNGAMHIGEMRGVFDYTTHSADVMACSCGVAFDECGFWNPLFEDKFGLDWKAKFQDIQIEGRMPRIRDLNKIDSLINNNNDVIKVQSNIAKATELLSDIQEDYNLSAIVDSSKSIPFVTLLNHQKLTNIIVIHLVRDPRANLFSWLNRPIPMPNEDGTMTVRVREEREAALSWIKENIAAQRLKKLGLPYYRIKYEDLVLRPYSKIKEIIDFCNLNNMNLTLESRQENLLKKNQYFVEKRHLIGSNPKVKNNEGIVTLKNDDTWSGRITSLQRIKWNLLFFPWLQYYHYSL